MSVLKSYVRWHCQPWYIAAVSLYKNDIHCRFYWSHENMQIRLILLRKQSFENVLWNHDEIFKVILHQFWVKKIFPWKFNLEYGSTFTKPFMHVSSRNMFPTTRNLQIHVHVYRPRHRCGDWLTFGCFVPMISDHDLVKKRYKQSWMLRKHAHIRNNDYWGICPFHVVWTIFFLVQLFLCGTHGIYIFFFHQLNIAHER